MSNPTANEIRAILEYALENRDPQAARTAIRIGIQENIEVHKMDDLHFGLMLLLAMPEPEKRGRPNDPEAEFYTWYLNMACKLKAEINEKSFSKTWAEYCDHRTRPKASVDELWRCAGILSHMVGREDKKAILAKHTFELTEADLESYKDVNK